MRNPTLPALALAALAAGSIFSAPGAGAPPDLFADSRDPVFAPPVAYTVGQHVRAVLAADLDADGGLAAGAYFCRLVAGGRSAASRIVIVP